MPPCFSFSSGSSAIFLWCGSIRGNMAPDAPGDMPVPAPGRRFRPFSGLLAWGGGSHQGGKSREWAAWRDLTLLAGSGSGRLVFGASGPVFHRLGLWLVSEASGWSSGHPAWSSTSLPWVGAWWLVSGHPARFSGHPAWFSTGWGWWSDQSAGFRALADSAVVPAVSGGRGLSSCKKSFFSYIYGKLNVCIPPNWKCIVYWV